MFLPRKVRVFAATPPVSFVSLTMVSAGWCHKPLNKTHSHTHSLFSQSITPPCTYMSSPRSLPCTSEGSALLLLSILGAARLSIGCRPLGEYVAKGDMFFPLKFQSAPSIQPRLEASSTPSSYQSLFMGLRSQRSIKAPTLFRTSSCSRGLSEAYPGSTPLWKSTANRGSQPNDIPLPDHSGHTTCNSGSAVLPSIEWEYPDIPLSDGRVDQTSHQIDSRLFDQPEPLVHARGLQASRGVLAGSPPDRSFAFVAS